MRTQSMRTDIDKREDFYLDHTNYPNTGAYAAQHTPSTPPLVGADTDMCPSVKIRIKMGKQGLEKKTLISRFPRNVATYESIFPISEFYPYFSIFRTDIFLC